MHHALRRYGCVKTKEAKRIKYQFSQRGLVTFGHMDYPTLVDEGYVSKSEGFEETFLEFWRNIKENGQYYCRETKAIVEELFAEDFEYFSYPLKSDSELLGDN